MRAENTYSSVVERARYATYYRPRPLALWLSALIVLTACENSGGYAYANRVVNPEQLIGGPGALGAIGDYALGNAHIRIIIQDRGWSRGMGIFGGGILDADIVRPGAGADLVAGAGQDAFGEFFPALFLEAFDVDDINTVNGVLPGIEIINDGTDGNAAVIRTRARGGNFLTLVTTLLDFGLPASLRFETDYVLEPGARHVEIRGRVINASQRAVRIPSRALNALLSGFGVKEFQMPLGDIALFGAGNEVFAPGGVQPMDGGPQKPVGFNLRFGVEDTYALNRAAPALPGFVADFVATAGKHVSYGIAVAQSDNNYIWKNREQYALNPLAPVSRHAMLVPFLINSFTGVYYELPPESLGPNETYDYTKYFIVGSGDVGSIRKELYRIRGMAVGEFYGRVRDALSGQAVGQAWIHIFDARKLPYSQVSSDAEGYFRTSLAPGSYYYVVTSEGRRPFSAGETRFNSLNLFTIKGPGREVYRNIALPTPAYLSVSVRDTQGEPLPAKVSVVGRYTTTDACQTCTLSDCTGVCAPRNYLFDFSLAERRRSTDFSWRNAPGKRDGEYVEKTFFVPQGNGTQAVRPSACPDNTQCETYDIYVSRGLEYDAHVVRNVSILPGQVSTVNAVLKRSVDTKNFIGADLHVHAQGSVDSALDLDTRVISAAGEGVEMLVATDHNVVTDYHPAILRNGLQSWVNSIVGVELSTLEMGHFNAFPVKLDPLAATGFPFVSACFAPDAQKVNGTSFDWVQCDPQTSFTNLRALGAYGPERTIVQVNHPRDRTLGYFNQFFLNPYSLDPEVPSGDNYNLVGLFYPHNDDTGQWEPDRFSWDFDALEVLNGKNLHQVFNFRTPANAPQGYIEEIQDYQCGSGHPFNARGEVLLRKGGHIAFPGAVNDWLKLLNRGFRFTATGNSDSHTVGNEVGFPRTYLHIEPNGKASRDLSPGAISDLDVVKAIREHRAMATNGPFLSMAVVTTIEGADASNSIVWPIGSDVSFGASNAGRELKVLLSIQSADWLRVDTIRVWANGALHDVIDIPEGQTPEGRDFDDHNAFLRTYTFDEDVVLVAEAMSDQNMFPFVTPNEKPPTNVSDAIDAVLSSVGAAGPSLTGVDSPDPLEIVTPYALSNPIWVDIDANGQFDPPGVNRGPGVAPKVKPGLCDRDLQCPPGQTCNTSRVPALCMCADNATQQEAPQGSMLYAPLRTNGPRGGRLKTWDIRRVFMGHDH